MNDGVAGIIGSVDRSSHDYWKRPENYRSTMHNLTLALNVYVSLTLLPPICAPPAYAQAVKDLYFAGVTLKVGTPKAALIENLKRAEVVIKEMDRNDFILASKDKQELGSLHFVDSKLASAERKWASSKSAEAKHLIDQLIKVLGNQSDMGLAEANIDRRAFPQSGTYNSILIAFKEGRYILIERIESRGLSTADISEGIQ